MLACFRNPLLEHDIASLIDKYPSIDQDMILLENLLRDSLVHAARCQEFIPDWVWRTEVHIQAFQGFAALDRCTLVFEKDRTAVYPILLYDNETHSYQDVVSEIIQRRGED